MIGPNTTLVWFQRDLRLGDHGALGAALADGGPILPVFIWAPEEETPWQPGAASCWWLRQSLGALDQSLRRCGSRLTIRRGPAQEALRQLVHETGAGNVYWNRRYEPAAIRREQGVAAALEDDGVETKTFGGALLYEPASLLTRRDAPYQVFGAFWKACLALGTATEPTPSPTKLPGPKAWPASVPLVDLGLEPNIDWAAGLRETWRPGEESARRGLRAFARDRVAAYAETRDRPDEDGTSRLSPHLHFGEISPRQVWWAIQDQCTDAQAAASFLRELGWREFAYHSLFHFPDTADAAFRQEFAAFPWRHDAKALRAWQRGKTGFPIVDAGMRELWQTGWMHNRVRMIVASFLVKDLLLPWQKGARWFWDTLVDADLANNTLNWQWTAGCGVDAAPYFRTFNPVTQGEKFDPDGSYVRRWVPELAGLSSAWIHRPWEAPPDVLREAGVIPGKTYPFPLLDHALARKRALAAYRPLRARPETWRGPKKVQRS